jgi:hypothetical protein
MRTRGRKLVGFLAVIVVTAVVNASDSFADAHRVDVIGNLGGTVVQSDGIKAQGNRVRVDVIERIGSGGAVYPYTKPMSR